MTAQTRIEELLVEQQTRIVMGRHAVKTAEEHLDEAIALSKMIRQLLDDRPLAGGAG